MYVKKRTGGCYMQVVYCIYPPRTPVRAQGAKYL